MDFAYTCILKLPLSQVLACNEISTTTSTLNTDNGVVWTKAFVTFHVIYLHFGHMNIVGNFDSI